MHSSIATRTRVVVSITALLLMCALPGLFGTADAQTLAPGWTVADVGAPRAPGGATFGAAVSMTSSGADVNGVADQFTFAYRVIRGEATVIARLSTLQNADPWSQAGVMLRESLDPRSNHAFLFATPANGVVLRHRKSARGGTTQVMAGAGVAPVWLKLERRSSDVTASRSADGMTWTVVGSSKLSLGSNLLVGLAVASRSAASVSASFSNVLVVGNGTLDAGYAASDIGSPLLGGGSWSGAGSFILDGAGKGIGGTSDQLRFVYRQLSGNQEVVARVGNFEMSPATSRAGILIRQTLYGGSPNAALMVGPGTGVAFTGRSVGGKGTANIGAAPGTTPMWLKLSREGAILRAAYSADGTTWTRAGEMTLALADPFYIGLGVTSGAPLVRARARFDGVVIRNTIPVVQNTAPSVAISSPAAGTSFGAPASLTVQATAADTDGTVAKVDFYVDSVLLASDTTSPYAFAWNNVAAGTYTFKAVATDDRGAATTSATRTISVVENAAPAVSLTSPAASAVLTAPATITLTATASDSDGTIAAVEFYSGTTLLARDATSPYAFAWRNVAAGNYSLTAVARDTQGGMTVSSARDITVTTAGAPITAIFTPASIHDSVDRYVLEIFTAGADPAVAPPLASQDLGKPAVLNGECSADVRVTIAALPAGSYIAYVSAQSSQDGTFRSAASPVFTR